METENQGQRQTSIFIPHDLWILAKQNLIEFRSALIFGIKFRIAEKEEYDYPENKLSKKIQDLMKIIQEQTEELENYKKISKISMEQLEKEADDILKDIGATK